MNNCIKHPKTDHASIEKTRRGNEIVLWIFDNGVGNDALKDKKGVGIINIRSRAELNHGSVTILSKPGVGYELKVILPLSVS